MENVTSNIFENTKRHCLDVYRRMTVMSLDGNFIYHFAMGNKYHCQIITKLRAAVQQSEEFTTEQFAVIESSMRLLRQQELKKDHVLEVLNQLMCVGLSPFPILDDEDDEEDTHG